MQSQFNACVISWIETADSDLQRAARNDPDEQPIDPDQLITKKESENLSFFLSGIQPPSPKLDHDFKL